MQRANVLLPAFALFIALSSQGVMAQDDKSKGDSSVATVCPSADMSPSKAYLELHKKVLQAKSYEDLVKLRSQNSIAQDPPMSDDDKKKTFPIFMMFQEKNIDITGEKLTGDKTAEVYATGDSPLGKVNGTIKLEKEGGQWKLFKESWQGDHNAKPDSK